MEEKVEEFVEIKKWSLAEENQKTMEVLKEREQALQDQLKLQHAKESVSNMQKLYELEQNQLFELRVRSAKQPKVSLRMVEVERAQAMLLSLERLKGYSSNSTDRKGTFVDDWGLSEAGGG